MKNLKHKITFFAWITIATICLTTAITLAVNLTDIEPAFDELTIQSFKDKANPLHEYLLQRIGPMLYLSSDGIASLATEHSDRLSEPPYIFFFQFLQYYVPNSENYNQLEPTYQYIITDLWERYHDILPLINFDVHE